MRMSLIVADKIDSLCILCGGKSSRMGLDKTHLMVQDLALYAWQTKRYKNEFKNIFLCAKEKITSLTLLDTSTYHSPLVGIETTLKILQKPCFILAVDTIISIQDLRIIISNFTDKTDACIGSFEGNLEPLVGVYSPKILEHLGGLNQDASLKSLLEKAKINSVKMLTKPINLNTNDDYKTFIKGLK